MKNNYYVIKNYNTTFGGKIYESDFNGHATMSNIAERIVSDWRFDEQCLKNSENRDKLK